MRYAKASPALLARAKKMWEDGVPNGKIGPKLGKSSSWFYNLMYREGWKKPIVYPVFTKRCEICLGLFEARLSDTAPHDCEALRSRAAA